MYETEYKRAFTRPETDWSDYLVDQSRRISVDSEEEEDIEEPKYKHITLLGPIPPEVKESLNPDKQT